MPRPLLKRNAFAPYHVTTRANNREWFSLPLDKVWKISLLALKEAYDSYPVDLISFVLMHNHYHMLIRTPDSNLDLFMYVFNKRFSEYLRHDSGRVNRMFGGRYKWCLIQSDTYLFNCYKYIYQNPLRAGLIANCEDYPYSTLNYLVHAKSFVIPICDIFGFKHGYNLIWLNQQLENYQVQSIRTALRGPELNSIKNRISRKEMRFKPPPLYI